MNTTIEKRRSRAFKRYKVYQNRTIIKEVRSKNVILFPQCSAGAGSARVGSAGVRSTGAGSTGAGSARAGSTGPGPRSGPVQPPGPDLSDPRVWTCPTPGSGPARTFNSTCYLNTTIEKRRSRAFKRYKVCQNRTIIKEVRSKNVILLPRCPAGARSTWAGSTGAGSTGAGYAGPDPGPDPLGLDLGPDPLGLDLGPDLPGPDLPGPDPPGPDPLGPDPLGPDPLGPDPLGPDPGPDPPGPDPPGLIHRGWILGRILGRIHRGPDLSNPRVLTCPTPGPDPPGLDPPGPDPGSGPVQPPGPDPSASTSRKKTFLLITSLIMVQF